MTRTFGLVYDESYLAPGRSWFFANLNFFLISTTRWALTHRVDVCLFMEIDMRFEPKLLDNDTFTLMAGLVIISTVIASSAIGIHIARFF
ncbi:hypothetical protein [Diaphorobacter sp. LR2014-1]|uniref:hypothetical protein n=1 Tax=Diaphorobacter sp. LR2014-1 TaxID=1933219 RepID=UPI0011AEF9C4|nr:hypothetical protein [Diaphorobacter sp. LR2014-1]